MANEKWNRFRGLTLKELEVMFNDAIGDLNKAFYGESLYVPKYWKRGLEDLQGICREYKNRKKEYAEKREPKERVVKKMVKEKNIEKQKNILPVGNSSLWP